MRVKGIVFFENNTINNKKNLCKTLKITIFI